MQILPFQLYIVFCKPTIIISPLENIWKSEVFWCFQGVQKWNLGFKWVKFTVSYSARSRRDCVSREIIFLKKSRRISFLLKLGFCIFSGKLRLEKLVYCKTSIFCWTYMFIFCVQSSTNRKKRFFCKFASYFWSNKLANIY